MTVVARRVFSVLALLLALAGCSSAPAARAEVEPSNKDMIQALAAAVRTELAEIGFTDAEKARLPADGRMRVRVMTPTIEYRMGDRFEQDLYLEQIRLAVSDSGKARPTEPDETPTHVLTAKIALGKSPDGGKATLFQVDLKNASMDKVVHSIARDFPWK